MEYYLNQHEERKCLNLLVNLASRHRIQTNAFEFDGLTGCGMGRLIDAAANEGLSVSMKPMPHTMESLLRTARDKYPNHDWSLKQDFDDFDWKQYIHIVQDDVMARALRSLKPRAQLDHIALQTLLYLCSAGTLR